MQYLFAPVASCGFPREADQSHPLSQRRQELDQMLKACDPAEWQAGQQRWVPQRRVDFAECGLHLYDLHDGAFSQSINLIQPHSTSYNLIHSNYE